MVPIAPLDILIVEDDADARANLRDILELDGHRVAEAASAAEALDREDWPRFAAIILDRKLPDLNAELLLPRLRRLAPEAAPIVVTGYSDIQGAIDALRQGASDYILKPLNIDILRASLHRVAERRELARAKERSEANFRHLVEAADVAILILRSDHTIAYFSPYAERLTGYVAAEVYGRDAHALLLPAADRPAAAEEFRRLLEGQVVQGYEQPILRRDGAPVAMIWNARRLPDYEGNPAILIVGQDITSLKQAQERALQAERLAAIGQMVAGLAHESRNALQRSQACLEMLALTVPDRPEALDLIARLQKAQDDLHLLYEDVRSYAAPIALDRRPCDLAAIWREAWAHLDAAHRGKNAVLREAIEGVDLRLSADPFRLGQVFRNILENALAAGRAPIEITIRAEEAELLGQPALRVTVQDNGPGLGPESRRRLFEPFYTTKTKGTGLGLPIAKRLIEAHGGRIALGDHEGQAAGAVFVITLPRGTP
ncbi:MAG: PAS domain S-box protein [Isosphaeraceae bacterium]|nr:PAS domain S-box protein [Isosphaeraceae bacterium]